MKTGLVLEGGAMRGMFTCGVLDVLMDHQITFDGTIGVSAGAVFGCNFKSGQKGRAIRYNKKYCGDKRYASMYSLLTTGDLFGVDFCYRKLPYELDLWDEEAYRSNPMEFYVTCTDAATGKPVYHRCNNGDRQDIKWMQASASMPMLSRPVKIGRREYLDGGTSDSIPVRYFESIGYDRNVVVLTQPADYTKKKNNMIPVAKVLLRKYPNMVKDLAERHLVYNETLDYLKEKEAKGEVLVIRPPEPLQIGKMEKDPEVLERVYQIGRKTAKKELQRIKEFLAVTEK